jgi:hypothetical protein
MEDKKLYHTLPKEGVLAGSSKGLTRQTCYNNDSTNFYLIKLYFPGIGSK